jgi:hypothetical protein
MAWENMATSGIMKPFYPLKLSLSTSSATIPFNWDDRTIFNKMFYPHLVTTNSFEGIIIPHPHLCSSNMREGVELQEQISFEESVVLHTLLSFEGI